MREAGKCTRVLWNNELQHHLHHLEYESYVDMLSISYLTNFCMDVCMDFILLFIPNAFVSFFQKTLGLFPPLLVTNLTMNLTKSTRTNKENESNDAQSQKQMLVLLAGSSDSDHKI